MPEWIFMEILTVTTPLVIGAGVIYIAWQQHKTNKDRLKMELFNQRFKVYEAMVELVTTKPITRDDVQKYTIKIAQAQFVFKGDIETALLEVGNIGAKIVIIEELHPRFISPGSASAYIGSEFKVPGTNGGALRICLANSYQRILYFSLKTMFCVLKLHGVLLKAPPLVPGTVFHILP